MSPMGRRARRSWLFTPATRPDRFARAGEAGADVLIIDLEDAVAPGDKDRARAAALADLDAGRGTAPVQALRVNGLRTRAGLDDLRSSIRRIRAIAFAGSGFPSAVRSWPRRRRRSRRSGS